jgi:erythromycin esterase-like protein
MGSLRTDASDRDLAHALTPYVRPLRALMSDFDPLLELAGSARCVLIGEASHGTHDFYRQRAQLTKRLIVEKGFDAVAVEADWPDAYRVNRYVRGLGQDTDASDALLDFRRFPGWMWRNADVLDFVGWLRDFNDVRPAPERVGFYGLDLYSLHASISAVLAHLDKTDADLARRARQRYACFDHFGNDPQDYGLRTALGQSPDCESAVVEQLLELREQRARLDSASLLEGDEQHFQAEQNARVVKSAEEYYRAMFRGSVVSWNLRDQHMAETLESLLSHLQGRSRASKIVVWAHNSHVGDARGTELAKSGELNIGQLTRERFGADAVLIGFTTYHGTVTAASDWGQPAQRMHVRPALENSYESLFHELNQPAFLLRSADLPRELRERLAMPRLQRAIGVVYRPESERRSHYYQASLSRQFDAVMHIDRTRALEPLEAVSALPLTDAAETYPSGV